jgi:uncharacterized Zn finger protein (UPF0148 family)
MNKCPKCKAKLITEHAFCPTCGFDLRIKKTADSSEHIKASEESPKIREILELTPPPLPKNDLQVENNLIKNKPRTQEMFSNPFSFNGRIRRTEYAISFIIVVIVNTFLNAIVEPGEFPIIGLVYITILWFLWAQGAKRCHDIGKDGWWQIIPFYFFWLLFQEGERESMNEYGQNPKG